MKTLAKAFLFTLAVAVAGTTFAADHRSDRRDHRGGPGAMPVIKHLTKALRRLDVTEEQKEGIRAELAGMREQIKPLIQQMHESRKALHGQITGDAYDADAVADLAARQGSLTTEITTITSGAAAAVLAQLTDEQRLELQAMGERFREKRAKRSERHKERKTETPPPDEG